jgi:ribose/xylose/arabinose/galactoside ABC-type transport system permease subunit
MIFTLGLVAMTVGLLLVSGVGRNWIGRLPGDIRVSGERFSFYFPIVTCLLASLLVTALLWLWRRF